MRSQWFFALKIFCYLIDEAHESKINIDLLLGLLFSFVNIRARLALEEINNAPKE